jgi:hypothetical protein
MGNSRARKSFATPAANAKAREPLHLVDNFLLHPDTPMHAIPSLGRAL